MNRDEIEKRFAEAEAEFAEYFRKNYPGPDTIIGNPDWHSPKLFRAATRIHARTALDALARLEDAEAAQALVVEQAVAIGADIAERTRPDGFPEEASNAYHSGAMDVVDAIRALADPSGVEALAALREERDALETAREMLGGFWAEAAADRDRLAAANAALEAQVARLVGVGQKLFWAARELRDYASYAEMVGGVSVNRPQIRKWCDAIAEIINTLPEDENYERSFAALAEVQADARREGGE